MNSQLEEDRHAARIDHRTLAAQEQAALQRGDEQAAAELHRIPLPRLTRNVMQIERKGFNTQAGDRRREVEQTNMARAELLKELKATATEMAVLEAEFDAREKDALARQQQQPVDRVEQVRSRTSLDKKQIQERAQKIWDESSAGQAEHKAVKQYEDDQLWSVKYRRDIENAKADLSAWKKEHPFQSLVAENVHLMDRVQEATRLYAAHQRHVRTAYENTLSFAEKKAAVWPGLLRQAADDLKQIVIKLLPEEVHRLIADAFEQDRDHARETFEELQASPQSVKVMNFDVQLAKGEDERFLATIRRLDKPQLDQRLIQLEERAFRTQRRQKSIESDRTHPGKKSDRDKGIGD